MTIKCCGRANMNKSIKNFNKIVNIFYFLGIITISYNKRLEKFDCSRRSCIYLAILFMANFLHELINNLNSTNIRISIEYLTDIYNISILIQRITIFIVYYSLVINCIKIGNKQATFLNEIYKFDVKIQENLRIPIKNEHFMQWKLSAFILIVGFFICRSAFYNFYLPKNWNLIQVTRFVQGYTVQLFIFYANYCWSILNIRFAIISKILCKQIKIKHDKDKINYLIGVYDELIDLKDLLNETFSLQILLYMFYNFSLFTITVYFMVIMLFDGYTIFDVFTLTLWIIPQTIGIFYFFATINTFYEQRIKIKRVIVKLMMNNDTVWV